MACQAGMAGMGGMEAWAHLVPLDHMERRETKESWDYQDHRETREYLDSRAHLEFLAPRGQWGRKVIVETPACLDLKDHRKPRAHQQEGQCMSAGGGPPVPLAREHNWSTLAELEGVSITTMVEQQTISVCQTTLNTCSIRVEFKEPAMCMEWSIT